MSVRETDLFYAQQWSDVTESWGRYAQALDFRTAAAYVRKLSGKRRIVRYIHSDVTGIPDQVVVLWQGGRVPEWLGEVVSAKGL